jgi:signal transduction histidine kinase
MMASRVDADQWTPMVSDSGAGIAAEQLSRLAEPFYRADPSQQRGSGVVGLGLYLSRAIAQAHRGRLEIRSTPDRGTRVNVYISIS